MEEIQERGVMWTPFSKHLDNNEGVAAVIAKHTEWVSHHPLTAEQRRGVPQARFLCSDP
jgi:hypothetical protein